MRQILVLIAASLVAGCGVRPDGSNGLRRDFDVPGMAYEQAYHHASSFFQQCARGFVGFAPNVVSSNLYPDTRTGEVNVANSSGVIVARATVTPTDSGAHVMVATIKHSLQWSEQDLDAVEASVKSGDIACR